MQTLTQLLINLVSTYGYLGIFVLMTAESALIPIPSEVTMPFAGFLAGRGVMNIWTAILIGATGNLCGSLLAYYLGIAKGEEWVRLAIKKWGKWLLIREEEFDKSLHWYGKYGQGITFVSRILPVVRTFISLPAGIAKMDIKLFTILTFVGSFFWSGILAFFGLKLGQNWLSIEPYFRKFQIVIILIISALILLYIYHHLKRRK